MVFTKYEKNNKLIKYEVTHKQTWNELNLVMSLNLAHIRNKIK